SSRRRHTRFSRDWSSDVCSSDLYLPYLSPRWQDMLRYTVSVADSLGMGIDLTQGTGWPFGGPWVSREEAASRHLTMKYELLPGQDRKSVEQGKSADAREVRMRRG